MLNLYARKFVNLVIGFLVIFATPGFAQEAGQTEREAMYYRYLEFPSYVKGGSIEPHWMADGSSFWYAEGAPENTVIYMVDPKANTKTELFDTKRLRQALTSVLEHEPPYKGLPFEVFTFVDDGEKAVQFTVEGREFILQLDTYSITRAPALSEEQKSRLVPQVVQKYFNFTGAGDDPPDIMEILSPDHRWFATVKDNNLWLRSTDDGRDIQLTTDGTQDQAWAGGGYYWHEWAWWAPDGLRLAVKKADYRKVRKYPIVDYLKPRVQIPGKLYH